MDGRVEVFPGVGSSVYRAVSTCAVRSRYRALTRPFYFRERFVSLSEGFHTSRRGLDGG